MNWRGDKPQKDERRPIGAPTPMAGRQPAAGEKDRQWRQSSAGQLIDRNLRYRIKLLAYTCLTLGLLGWLVRWLLFLPLPTPWVAFVESGYPFPIPPNALAIEDAALATDLFREYANVNFKRVENSWSTEAELLTSIRDTLSKMRLGGPDSNTLIFELNAHGAVNDENEACLILPTSDPRDSRTWVPLRRVLNAFAETDNVSQANKLLLLDAGKLSQVWSLGIIFPTFPARVAALSQELAIPRLAILTSHDLGQTSQLMPDQGCSSFGYFVAHGLRGAARGNDNRVTLHELADYVTRSSDRFARTRRSSRQQPRLIPTDAADFPLVYVTGVVEPSPHPIETAAIQGDLDELWSNFAHHAERRAYATSPLDWAEIEQRLLRQEQLLTAGAAYHEQLQSNSAWIKSKLSELDASAWLTAHDAYSLALAEQLEPLPPMDLAKAKESYAAWRAAVEVTPAPPEPPPIPQLAPRVAAAFVWDSLSATAPTLKGLDALLNFADASRPHEQIDFSEIHFARTLHRDLDWQGDAAALLPLILKLQDVAEKTTAVQELRTHYWLHDGVSQADTLLRTQWDRLFVGRADQLNLIKPAATQMLDGASTSSWPILQQLDAQGYLAYRTRDEACTMLPHLASWLERSALSSEQAEQSAPISLPVLREALSQAVQTTHQLAAALQNVSGSVAQTEQLEPVTVASERLQRHLDTLQTAFSDQCRRLWVEDANDQWTFKQIEVALSVPLLPGDDVRIRNELRRRYFTRRDPAAPQGTSGTFTRRCVSHVQRCAGVLLDLTQRATHASLELLDTRALLGEQATARESHAEIDAPREGLTTHRSTELQVARVAEIGLQLRDQLRAGNARRIDLFKQSNESVGRGDPPHRARLSLLTADHLSRAAAPLTWGRDWPTSSEDPSTRLQRFDAQSFLFWQASRALDDFWGPSSAGAENYFSQQTQRLLRLARRQIPEPTPYRDQLEKQLALRESAAREWVPLSADDLHFTPAENEVRHEIHVAANTEVPPGQMAIYLQRTDGTAVLLRKSRDNIVHREPADNARDTVIAYELDRNARRDAVSLDTIALFRGHRKPFTYFLDAGANATATTFVRQSPPPARILVTGNARQAMQVMFVLDCSYSMRFKHTVENRVQTRMQLATQALTEIIQQMDGNEYQVGLILYGHRAGWLRDKPRYRDATVDRGLHPGADVETVIAMTSLLRPNPLTGRVEDTRRQFYTALDALRPLGETPLYYALTQALASFNTTLPGSRDIILVTDGVDRQSPDTPSSAKRNLASVQNLLNDASHRARIDVIGFRADPSVFDNEFDRRDWEENEKQMWQAGRSQALLDLTRRTGGEFHDVTDPGQMVNAPRDSLRISKFYVRPTDPTNSPPVEVDLAHEWVASSAAEHGRFEVGIVDQPAIKRTVELEVGEALALRFNRQQQQLEFQRYTEELSGDGILLPRGGSPRYFVAAHIPQRQSRGDVWFRASFQNALETEAGLHPAALWAEFRPILPGGQAAKESMFVAYDREWEHGRPVPIVRFRISGWPAEAERAEMRCWFADSPPQNLVSIPFDLETESVQSGPGNTKLKIQPARHNDGRLTVVIEEQHPSDSDRFPLWLQLSPEPDEAHHTWIADSQRARHEYIYTDAARVRLAQPKLEATTVRELQETWIDTGPLPVELPHR